MIKTEKETKVIPTEDDNIEILIGYKKITEKVQPYVGAHGHLVDDSSEAIELTSVEVVIGGRSVEFLRQLTQNQIDYLKKQI